MDINGMKVDLLNALDDIIDGGRVVARTDKVTPDYTIKVYECGSIIRCDIKLADISYLDEELPF